MRVIYRKYVMRVIYTLKKNVEKVWGVRYTLGASYLSKNTVLKITAIPNLMEKGQRVQPLILYHGHKRMCLPHKRYKMQGNE